MIQTVFNPSLFSRDLKVARYGYQYGKEINKETIHNYLHELADFDLSTLETDIQKTAFWINVYNGMTNYAIIKFRIKTSMKELADFFKKPLFSIGELEFSLDDVEHGLLRRNARQHLALDDPKLKYAVNTIDYRIHFALNCGAQSCPAIAFYTEEKLDEELAIAETSFASQEFIVNDEEKTIQCSPLFEWYKEDFGNHYLNAPQYQNYKVMLVAYHWEL